MLSEMLSMDQQERSVGEMLYLRAFIERTNSILLFYPS